MSLLTALQSGDQGLVESICASGASANELEDGASPMHIVVGLHKHNSKELTKILLQYGGDPNVENEEGLTPVHVSVIRGNNEILQLLLRNGGDTSKSDEEGRDAWDYALKYSRKTCQQTLREHMDEETLPESDVERNQYVSIFHKDVPLTNGENSRLSNGENSRLSNASSELNRGFVRTSFGSTVPSSTTSPNEVPYESGATERTVPVNGEASKYVPPRGPPPQPPPRRSKSVKSVNGDSAGSQDGGQLSRSSSYSTPPGSLRCHQELVGRPTSLPLSADTKRNKNIFSVIKKTLSPGTKPTKQDSSGGGTKPKSRSPLTSLLKSPAKHKFARADSCISPGTVRFDIAPDVGYERSQSAPSSRHTTLSRSQSLPCESARCQYTACDQELLMSEIPVSIDATSPDHCIVTTARTASSRKRLDLDTVDRASHKYSPSNYNQTSQKPERDKGISPFQSKHRRKSSKSLFKRLIGSSPSSGDVEQDDHTVNIGVGQTVQLSEWNPNDSVSQLSVDVTHQQHHELHRSASGHSSDGFIDSKEMAAIEAGRKVFDVTSPDHCVVVDVDLTMTAPLDKTIVYTSPPPKPQRLFISRDEPTQSLSPADSIEGNEAQTSTSNTTEPSVSNLQPKPSERINSCAENSQLPVGVIDLGPAIRSRAKSLTSAGSPKTPAKATPSRDRIMDLRGSLTAELEQQFKLMQLRMESPEPAKIKSTDSTLNHRWSSKGKGKLVKQKSVEFSEDSKSKPSLTAEKRAIQLGQAPRPYVRSKSVDVSSPGSRYSSVSSPKPVRIDWEQPVERTKVLKPQASISKDSGIESNVTPHTRDQRRVSDSEDSFHTCQSGSVTQLNSEKLQSPLLPTEMDSVQSKVQRMNLDDFGFFTSDNNSESTENLNQSKYITTLASSICASDGSIAEYLHRDLDTNVTLTEARWPITCTAINHSRRSIDWRTFSELSICSSDARSSEAPIAIPRDILYLSDACLLSELRELGDVPGPITTATRRAYQLRLLKLRNNPRLCTPNKLCGFSRELQQYLSCHADISLVQIGQWEQELINQFDTGSGRKWREGNSKMSFTYLLLDPRTTKNLPARHHLLDSEGDGEAFRVFLSSVFYIGKGKKTRPYQHFIEAIRKKNTSDKTQQIVDIWKSGLGVVSLHVFHNILAVEAYTREACMVDAIGLKNLTNIAKCNYYGLASTWNTKKKRLVGANLLNKAYNILLMEGERQIRPADIRDESELPSFLV